jgi:nitroreductase
MTGVDLYQGILTTRALRRYTDEPVSDDDIAACLRAANQAPSGGNIQPWQFLVITDPDARKAVGELYRRAYHRYEAALVAVRPPARNEADEASFQRTLAASRHLADHLGEAPVLVLFLMPNIDLTLTDDEGPLDIGTTYASVYPAVQNFMLAARSRGLGTVLTTVYRIHQNELRSLLDVPDHFEIVALVPVGHPTGNFGEARRRPVAKVTHWDRYGNRRG